MTNSGNRAARRVLVRTITLGTLFGLAGCVPSVEPSAAPSATAATVQNIGSRFPDAAEWEEHYDSWTYCAIGITEVTECEASRPGTLERWFSNGFQLREDTTAVTAGAVVLDVTRFETAEEALADVELIREKEAKYDGEFDLLETATDDGGYIPGARGSGEFIEFQNAQWSGFRLDYVAQQLDTYGIPLGDPTATVTVAATQADLSFVLRLYWVDPAVVDEEADYWLERVFGTQ